MNFLFTHICFFYPLISILKILILYCHQKSYTKYATFQHDRITGSFLKKSIARFHPKQQTDKQKSDVIQTFENNVQITE